jgi:hypothetical protein
LEALDRAAFAAPLYEAIRQSELVCTAINTRREISQVWRSGYVEPNAFFRWSNLAKPYLANQANAAAIAATRPVEVSGAFTM